ncbi:hypothetical protein O181_005311 [Austropuccinia psidii MF-1]|uniref:Reverse transcriptase Ty1/copia-type domain-containing protein n=1 Tax=Austropuccinia psidii MF-1 TaxID=1389203 RepID=A0A9Q3GFS9_9BASI|nr:hypothetical protein [Austropuccinia psidii MF-1]
MALPKGQTVRFWKGWLPFEPLQLAQLVLGRSAGGKRSPNWRIEDEYTKQGASLLTEPTGNSTSADTKTVENRRSDHSEVPEYSSIESVSTLNSPTLPAVNNDLVNLGDFPNQQQPRTNNRTHCLKVLGPRHPTLITSNVDSIHILPYLRRAKTFITTSTTVPRTYWLALQCKDKEKWTNAIKRELLSMNELKVWDIVDLGSDYKLVGTTWVFKLKKDHLHQTVEHKARLCAQGFTQTPGVDFDKTYAPMGQLNSLRALISHSCANGLDFHQIDVKSAFLNASLTETVYLSIPQGLEIDRQKYCLRLKKAIYGLKQAPPAW